MLRCKITKFKNNKAQIYLLIISVLVVMGRISELSPSPTYVEWATQFGPISDSILTNYQ